MPQEKSNLQKPSGNKPGRKKGCPPPPNAGKGRRKGSLNRATSNAREAIARFVDGNIDRLEDWLDEIAEKDGAKDAFRCFMDVVEYHVPKLQRTEVTGVDGKDLIPAESAEAIMKAREERAIQKALRAHGIVPGFATKALADYQKKDENAPDPQGETGEALND